MDSSDFKSNESFFKKDSPDQKYGLGFAERNTKSVLRSKIRFWIHRKEHTLLGVFNKTIIPLALVGYEMIIANSALRASLAI